MSQLPTVTVSGTIRLGQFLKLTGLVEDGAQARTLIQEGDVEVNGQVDTRRGRQLTPGDEVVVRWPTGSAGARVGAPADN
ncbi:RNA-binding S4 domain-containing protein [Actinomyces sp. F1_1611]